ncbi:hypothetical protein Gpo141_00010067 [Globisporangium polare]
MDETRLSTSSNPGGSAAREATVEEAQEWSSVVVDYTLRLEHVALDITTDRILYHLHCEFEQPIPATFLAHCEFICMGYPLGGIWKVQRVDQDNRFVSCVAWRKTELTPEDVAEIAKKYEPLPVEPPLADAEDGTPAPKRAIRPPPQTLFDWKMQLGTWDKRNHWFVHEIGISPAIQEPTAIPEDTLLMATLLVGPPPVEASLVVNSVTAVDTVAQSFSADVTWTLNFPGLTAIREDSALRELLDILEFKEDELEFTNITDVHDAKAVMSILEPAGRIKYLDPFVVSQEPVTQRLYHLKYSRRVIAQFNEEMSLYYFPFDQQKLTFSFNMGKSIRSSLQIAPPSADPPGRFALENFKLNNVFDVVFGDKLFVGKVIDNGSNKLIRFEMMLERQSGYYLTNVGIPAAIITYLTFITYAPLDDGGMIDVGSRLQIVVTLLLTNVTFKYNLAALIPQVSYFTMIDKYVFLCFLITCVVSFENALFPLFKKIVGVGWKENNLLWISFGAFTVLNLVWGAYVILWVKLRNYRCRILLMVNEYVRIIAQAIPNKDKEVVLRAYLRKMAFKEWAMPQLATTKRGDLFVQLPSDSPTEAKEKSPHEPTSGIFRKQALRDLPSIQKFYNEMATTTRSGGVASPALLSPVGGRGAGGLGIRVNSPVGSAGAPPPVEGVAAVVAKEYAGSNASVVVNVNVQDDLLPTTPYSAYKDKSS